MRPPPLRPSTRTFASTPSKRAPAATFSALWLSRQSSLADEPPTNEPPCTSIRLPADIANVAALAPHSSCPAPVLRSVPWPVNWVATAPFRLPLATCSSSTAPGEMSCPRELLMWVSTRVPPRTLVKPL